MRARAARAAKPLMLAVLLGARGASAQFSAEEPRDPLEEAKRLSASPDVAAMSLGWRGHLRGTVGGDFRIFDAGAEDRLALHLAGAVELHNVVDNAVPNNLWRGLLRLELAYRFPGDKRLGEPRLALFVQHESDHETVDLVRYFQGPLTPSAPVGYYQFNSAGLRGDVAWRVAGQRLAAGFEPRIHFLSCNASYSLCASGVQGWGSPAFEAIAEAVWSGPLAPTVGRWEPFASLFGDWLAPSGLVHTERRAVLDVGAWVRTRRGGLFAFFVTGFAGNDVGYLRQERVTQAGAGFRWTP